MKKLRKAFAFWVVLDYHDGRELTRSEKMRRAVEHWNPGTVLGYSERSFEDAIAHGEGLVARWQRVQKRLRKHNAKQSRDQDRTLGASVRPSEPAGSESSDGSHTGEDASGAA